MIIVDSELGKREKEGRPIRVAMVGAGFMGRGIALQIISAVRGMRLVAISNRHIERARRAYLEAGVEEVEAVNSVAQLERAIQNGRYAVTEDPFILCKAGLIDVIVEVTGTVEFAAKVVLCAIENKKHVILMNAELDGTLGPILKVYADKAGVVITNADGDQPGAIMNLYRFVKGIGVKPILCGNIKGFHDPYRNPATQEEFARKWKQSTYMVTSFSDGTKISFEQAVVANATGMKVARRGMYGPKVTGGTFIKEAVNSFPLDTIIERGEAIVDYVVGAEPSPGVFVLGTHDHPSQQFYLAYYKLGNGPLYCFYTPYHLCHFEVPNTIARVVLFHDATIAPLAGPVVNVVATAKKDLKKNEVLDGMGGYMLYGQCENAEIAAEQSLLPIGLAEGSRLNKDVAKDSVLTYHDILPLDGMLRNKLRAEQDEYFKLTPFYRRHLKSAS